ncbi:putative spermidine/putrescine transport system substrate-binding protein [Bradyrhizobium sp. USDA 4461]
MRKKVSRRFILFGGTSLVAAPTVLRVTRAAAKFDPVTFTGYGGTYQETLVRTVLNPFTEETGINVNVVPIPDLARVKAQLLTGNVEWDIYDVSGSKIEFGSKNGFWEKLDPSIFDVEDIAIQPATDHVAFSVFVAGIAWNPTKYGLGKHPSSFADYFDLKRFPGRRALRNQPNETMEMALVADGVAPMDLYPLDVDRAFKALDRIKPSIASWINAVTQSISLVQTGEVDFSYTYANRVKATNEPGGGVPLALSFEQNLLDTESLAVLKGAPNKEGAMKLLAYFLRPEVQARFENQIAGIPVSKKALALLSAETRKWQPDLDNPNHIRINNGYWVSNFSELSRRFKEWVLS